MQNWRARDFRNSNQWFFHYFSGELDHKGSGVFYEDSRHWLFCAQYKTALLIFCILYIKVSIFRQSLLWIIYLLFEISGIFHIFFCKRKSYYSNHLNFHGVESLATIMREHSKVDKNFDNCHSLHSFSASLKNESISTWVIPLK